MNQTTLAGSGILLLALVFGTVCETTAAPSEPGAQPQGAQSTSSSVTASQPAAAAVPSDYIIGPDDALSVLFWGEKEMSAEVVVRPDGKISVPLVNDVQAAGLTPEQLRKNLTEAARRYVEDPNVTVVVRGINSRKVFITGQVSKPGAYALTGSTTVLHLLALAGDLTEFGQRQEHPDRPVR